MSATNCLIFLAFASALNQLDSPLPEELRKQVNKAGKLLTTDEEAAAIILREVAVNSSLKEHYKTAYRDLYKLYDPQTRKTIPDDSDEEDKFSYYLENSLPQALPKLGKILQDSQPDEKIKSNLSSESTSVETGSSSIDYLGVNYGLW